jgi:hypothetical protein
MEVTETSKWGSMTALGGLPSPNNSGSAGKLGTNVDAEDCLAFSVIRSVMSWPAKGTSKSKGSRGEHSSHT